MADDFYRSGQDLSRRGILQIMLEEAYRDGTFSQEERKTVQYLRKTLKLTDRDYKHVRERIKEKYKAGELTGDGEMDPLVVYRRAIELAFSDGKVSGKERTYLKLLGKVLWITPEEHANVIRQIKSLDEGSAQAIAIPDAQEQEAARATLAAAAPPAAPPPPVPAVRAVQAPPSPPPLQAVPPPPPPARRESPPPEAEPVKPPAAAAPSDPKIPASSPRRRSSRSRPRATSAKDKAGRTAEASATPQAQEPPAAPQQPRASAPSRVSKSSRKPLSAGRGSAARATPTVPISADAVKTEAASQTISKPILYGGGGALLLVLVAFGVQQIYLSATSVDEGEVIEKPVVVEAPKPIRLKPKPKPKPKTKTPEEKAEEHYARGIKLLQDGKLKDAIAAYKKGIAEADIHAYVHNNLGHAYERKGDDDAAIREYQQAIQLDAKYPLAYNNLGTVYERKGRNVEAMALYKKAVELKPDYANAHYNLGVLFGRSGRYDDAIKEFKAVVQARPDDPYAHKDLWLAYTRKGMEKEAKQELEAARRLGLRIGD